MDRANRRMAVNLRMAGKSYSEIKRVIGVPKSSLSYWLKDTPLSETQRAKLIGRYKEGQIENFINTMRAKREARKMDAYRLAAKSLLPLTDRELRIAGLFLYLGEGSKRQPGQILVSNTDPDVIKFALYWYEKSLGIMKDKIKVGFQIYKDMDTKEESLFWSRHLRIPLKNFWKPYIKNSGTATIDHSGHKHGTCTLYYGNVSLHEDILMSIQCILDASNRRA